MKGIYWLLGPQALLTGVGISYFWLLASLDFRSADAPRDLFMLGLVAFLPSLFLFRTRFSKRSFVSRRDASVFLACICAIFLPIVGYLLTASGGLVALVDSRFSVPGFGVISSFYFVGAIAGAAICTRSRQPALVALFLLLSGTCGFIVGGKGFAGSIVFGFALAARLGWVRFGGWALATGLAACAAGFFLAVVDKAESVLLVLWIRLELAADAVRWVSALSDQEIARFSVSWWSFLADIPLRFVGVRFNSRSIGSEIAYVVAGDESGGGPNPVMPVIAYLSTGANRLGSLLFLLSMLALVGAFVGSLRRKARSDGVVPFLCAVGLALSPELIIDVIGFLQQAFWLLMLGLFFTLCRRLRRRRRRRRSSAPAGPASITGATAGAIGDPAHPISTGDVATT